MNVSYGNKPITFCLNSESGTSNLNIMNTNMSLYL